MPVTSTSYSGLFQTLYDELHPVGQLGRGTHYSVFSAAQWRSPFERELLVYPLVQRVAVIWDEDHDVRVIRALEAGYMNGLLAPVLFIGERKASLTVVVHDEADISDFYRETWDECVERVIDDHWDVRVIPFSDVVKEQMIHDHRQEAVTAYVANVRNLWKLGMHTHISQRYQDSSGTEVFVDFAKRK
jgi:hypothetical protein